MNKAASMETASEPVEQHKVVLELEVNNHPGVMSHVCNLFARRAFNVEGILCMPMAEEPARSNIWLLVYDDRRLQQMLLQLEKLVDVLAVRRHGAGHEVFAQLEQFFR